MKTKTQDFAKVTVTLNTELDKYREVVLFPEKVKLANEMLKKYGLPKEKPKE
jgi:hypothetical protein